LTNAGAAYLANIVDAALRMGWRALIGPRLGKPIQIEGTAAPHVRVQVSKDRFCPPKNEISLRKPCGSFCSSASDAGGSVCSAPVRRPAPSARRNWGPLPRHAPPKVQRRAHRRGDSVGTIGRTAESLAREMASLERM